MFWIGRASLRVARAQLAQKVRVYLEGTGGMLPGG